MEDATHWEIELGIQRREVIESGEGMGKKFCKLLRKLWSGGRGIVARIGGLAEVVQKWSGRGWGIWRCCGGCGAGGMKMRFCGLCGWMATKCGVGGGLCGACDGLV
ncbi:hypothetical protein CsSME_00032934 [Camellia sinensis var. sinensis]